MTKKKITVEDKFREYAEEIRALLEGNEEIKAVNKMYEYGIAFEVDYEAYGPEGFHPLWAGIPQELIDELTVWNHQDWDESSEAWNESGCVSGG